MAMRVMTTAVALLMLLVSLTGCNGDNGIADDGTIAVEIKGQTFHLELATDEQSRMRGLGGRESIPEDGGMIFIFPEPALLSFHMKDCLVDIDIIFIDARGRITAMHEMTAQPLRRPEESMSGYEARLRDYSSGSRAQFAIELRSGWLDTLDLNVQDKLELDIDSLKAMAQ